MNTNGLLIDHSCQRGQGLAVNENETLVKSRYTIDILLLLYTFPHTDKSALYVTLLTPISSEI